MTHARDSHEEVEEVETVESGQESRQVVNGVTLQVFHGGQGPILLVLHDCEVMTVWQPYHAALAAQCTVLAPSHPGFGASEGAQSLDSIDDLAYFYLDFVASLGQEVDVLGLGMGGWVAAEMAVRCGHGLRRLIHARQTQEILQEVPHRAPAGTGLPADRTHPACPPRQRPRQCG